jgi:hypothetical protein
MSEMQGKIELRWKLSRKERLVILIPGNAQNNAGTIVRGKGHCGFMRYHKLSYAMVLEGGIDWGYFV